MHAYRSSSLYHRNLGFFFLGITGGSLWGARQRRTNEARNADCAFVHLTFYDLSRTESAQSEKKEASVAQEKARDVPLSTKPKRRFEQLWGEAARLLQRQPGYTYTLMFRKIMSSGDADELTKQLQTEVIQQPQRSGHRGIRAGLELTADVNVPREEQPALDYVEMRVWENEESRLKAQDKQMPLLQKMQNLGVEMSGGRYRRVFDDALVRLIQ